MKPTDFLKQHHREAESLFEQIEASVGHERMELVQQLADALSAHMAVEEEVFYPRVAKAIEDDDLIDEAFEEHGVARTELARVLAADDDDIVARAKVLKDLIEHHVKEEEEELFPEVEGAMEPAELEQLTAEMKPVHEEAMEAGHDAVMSRLQGTDLRGAGKMARPRAGL